MAAKRNAVAEIFWRVHPRLYRWSGGRVIASMKTLPVLLLTTVGRKTGRPRTVALMYLPRGRDFVVIASFLGEPVHPSWWLNLEARPDARVQVGAAQYDVLARRAEGEEREDLWRAFEARTSDYNETQARTARRFPVVVLERR